MNKSAWAGLAAGVASIGAAAAFVAPAIAAATNSSSTQTLSLVRDRTWKRTFGGQYSIASGNEKNSSGTHVYSDVASCHAASNGAVCDLAFTLKNGLLYATVTIAHTGNLTGTVTGGTRAYSGDSGTVTGTARSSTSSKITIKFHH